MIVDASVALKWLIPEPDSHLAVAVLAQSGLSAPDLIIAEVANALCTKVRTNELAGLPARFESFIGFFDTIVPSAPLMARAVAIAIDLRHPAYDCFYLALAEATDEFLLTADARFIAACKKGRYASRLRLLGPG